MNYIVNQCWLTKHGLDGVESTDPDTTYVAERWADDCVAACERAVHRFAGREPCGTDDLTNMERIAIAMAAGVEMDYQFIMNTVRVTTRNKIGITWADGQFHVAVLVK